MNLKGIHGVRLDNRKTLPASIPRTKYFSTFLCRSTNYVQYI